MSAAEVLRVVDNGLDEARARDLVRRRSLRSRARAMVGGPPEVNVLGPAYWPIALVHATARGTGRRPWVDRVQGAVDLVSGRIGLVDADLPDARDMAVEPNRIVAPRLSRTEALSSWHEYFRDYADRRRKPLRPPALSVDRVERFWLVHQVASCQGDLFLVDPVTGRADPLTHFPWIEQSLESQTRGVGQAS